MRFNGRGFVGSGFVFHDQLIAVGECVRDSRGNRARISFVAIGAGIRQRDARAVGGPYVRALPDDFVEAFHSSVQMIWPVVLANLIGLPVQSETSPAMRFAYRPMMAPKYGDLDSYPSTASKPRTTSSRRPARSGTCNDTIVPPESNNPRFQSARVRHREKIYSFSVAGGPEGGSDHGRSFRRNGVTALLLTVGTSRRHKEQADSKCFHGGDITTAGLPCVTSPWVLSADEKPMHDARLRACRYSRRPLLPRASRSICRGGL